MVQAGIERSSDAARSAGRHAVALLDRRRSRRHRGERAGDPGLGWAARAPRGGGQGAGLRARRRLVAAAALEAGADGLAVARVREGVRLRDLGVTAPMLLLAAFTPKEADTLVANDLTPTVVEERQLALLSQAAERAGRQVPVHVKLDTGMRRYGAPVEEAIPVAASVVRACRTSSLEGFYTHFATADAPDLGFAREQLAAFQTACGRLEAQGIRPRYLHAANSAGTLAMREAHYDLVRVGAGRLRLLRHADRHRGRATPAGGDACARGSLGCWTCRRAAPWATVARTRPRGRCARRCSPSATPMGCPAAIIAAATCCSTASAPTSSGGSRWTSASSTSRTARRWPSAIVRWCSASRARIASPWTNSPSCRAASPTRHSPISAAACPASTGSGGAVVATSTLAGEEWLDTPIAQQQFGLGEEPQLGVSAPASLLPAAGRSAAGPTLTSNIVTWFSYVLLVENSGFEPLTFPLTGGTLFN